MWTKTFLIVVTFFGLAFGTAQAAETPASPAHFGAVLTTQTQPSPAKGDFCSVNTSHPTCTFLLTQAFKCEFGSCKNGHLAPKAGTLASVSLIACYPGTFVLQIANANETVNKAQVVKSGPVIDYVGDPEHCNGTSYKIESFKVDVTVEKGQYLAVDTQNVGFVNCSGGGKNMLLFDPPLPDGGPVRTANKPDGCFMLLEAFYTD
jgi:hypothetical protein